MPEELHQIHEDISGIARTYQELIPILAIEDI